MNIGIGQCDSVFCRVSLRCCGSNGGRKRAAGTVVIIGKDFLLRVNKIGLTEKRAFRQVNIDYLIFTVLLSFKAGYQNTVRPFSITAAAAFNALLLSVTSVSANHDSSSVFGVSKSTRVNSL